MNRGILALLPSLRLPDGASFSESGGGSGSSGRDEAESRSRVTTDLSAVQLMAHFEPQLRAQGWTTVEQVRGDGIAVLHARKTHESGALLFWVAAYRAHGGEFSLSMNIRRVS